MEHDQPIFLDVRIFYYERFLVILDFVKPGFITTHFTMRHDASGKFFA